MPYSMEHEFEDIAAVIGSIPEPVTVLGHSYGAICSLEAALLTRNVAALILHEPPIPTGFDIYPPGAADRIQKLTDTDDREGAVATFFRQIVRMPEHEIEMLRSLPAWKARVAASHTIAREMIADEQYRFVPERFRDPKLPALLLLGGDSPAFFKRAVEMVHQSLSGSRIVVMAGQQHAAMNTSPELFSAEVLKFLVH
jgi:pimeloyl-ACP methyl ester carboxylesterase